MEQLEETLRHAYVLITSCGDSSYLHSCLTGGKQADQLREVQDEIVFCLQLFPLVSLVDTNRTLERLTNGDHPSSSEVATDELHHSECDDDSIRLRTKDHEAIKLNPQQKSGKQRTEEGGEKILVYEYMPNRSLAFIISDEKKRELLKWCKRLQIIKAVADGLAYLHGHSHVCIVHRSFGSKDILLDHSMNAKISDFGLAIMLAPDTYAEVTVVGRYGYVAPEYAITGRISEKADVYHFGVVLLEIIRGMRCTAHEIIEMHAYVESFCETLPDHAHEHRKNVQKLVDPLLDAKGHERAQIMECIEVALLCIQDLPENRPAMSEVVTMLDSMQAGRL